MRSRPAARLRLPGGDQATRSGSLRRAGFTGCALARTMIAAQRVTLLDDREPEPTDRHRAYQEAIANSSSSTALGALSSSTRSSRRRSQLCPRRGLRGRCQIGSGAQGILRRRAARTLRSSGSCRRRTRRRSTLLRGRRLSKRGQQSLHAAHDGRFPRSSCGSRTRTLSRSVTSTTRQRQPGGEPGHGREEGLAYLSRTRSGGAGDSASGGAHLGLTEGAHAAAADRLRRCSPTLLAHLTGPFADTARRRRLRHARKHVRGLVLGHARRDALEEVEAHARRVGTLDA